MFGNIDIVEIKLGGIKFMLDFVCLLFIIGMLFSRVWICYCEYFWILMFCICLFCLFNDIEGDWSKILLVCNGVIRLFLLNLYCGKMCESVLL